MQIQDKGKSFIKGSSQGSNVDTETEVIFSNFDFISKLTKVQILYVWNSTQYRVKVHHSVRYVQLVSEKTYKGLGNILSVCFRS